MISFIIPSYNDLDNIKRQVSFFNNYSASDLKFEVIFVDDHSTDGTYEYLKSTQILFEFKCHFNEVNSGPGISRNIGMGLATYETLAFIDSDDSLIEAWPFYFSRMLSCDADCRIFPYQLIVKNSENIYKMHPQDEKIFSKWGSTYSSDEYLWNANWVLELANFPWNKLYKKSIIEKFDIKYPDLRMQEDIVFHWMYMIHCKSVKLFSNLPGLYKHNRSENNAGRATEYKGKYRLDLFSALDIVEDKLSEDWLNGYVPVFYEFKCDIINWGKCNISVDLLDEYRKLAVKSLNKLDETKKEILIKYNHQNIIDKIKHLEI
ncbi:glycosyltransferase family 2 protein [Vibrio nitrifigilis]|uniref:Glycosyltransferase family 2 protein n=1 Tax=Vibrio nitrifigilis TaxID=2789781 RepID=A0ABS0GFM0_9VIBR|nr:glycosyltransferase family A protein [Vibrio nitrifigilis]MBF9001203.1 glycosyltransferase family 2 protein [Vibrio nitrifigilis]